MTVVATAMQPEPRAKCCQPSPKKSRFWRGFLLGIPVYPLVAPWLIFGIPAPYTETYLRLYGEYVKMVMQFLG